MEVGVGEDGARPLRLNIDASTYKPLTLSFAMVDVNVLLTMFTVPQITLVPHKQSSPARSGLGAEVMQVANWQK